ncbi:MAG: S-methyl-5-thioribose-1-phosphate isomerase [Actinomycetota bacterium]|nr:S-methyl-5-thioribose-1-phosphate isomerase [Actinomycetota bacterium]
MGDRHLGNSSRKKSKVGTLRWKKNVLELIDQRKLPFKETYVKCSSVECVARSIKDMVVRGAPAIGVAAAYGVALAALEFKGSDKKEFTDYINRGIEMLSRTRPTAVNLFWALDRMKETLNENKELAVKKIKEKLVKEAAGIEKHDLEINFKIGRNGKEVFKGKGNKLRILTHCNAGALATSGYGTALGVIRHLNNSGNLSHVIVDETRPFLQGARLTSWELYQEGITFFIISDNMAAYFMSRGEIDAVLVGADRIALNGDTANKIGTLGLSVIAGFYGVPFYVAAPLSTVDIKIESGDNIPIEYRDNKEMREILGNSIIPEFMPVVNPAFDITPAGNITAIITEEGVIYPPYREGITRNFNGKS